MKHWWLGMVGGVVGGILTIFFIVPGAVRGFIKYLVASGDIQFIEEEPK